MKRAIVTGGSSGLGAAIVSALADNDFEVYNWSLPGVDVRSPGSIMEAVSDLLGTDPVDILVNCAGVNRLDWLDDLSEDDWNEVFDTNVKGIFLVSQALLPKLIGGTIVNISSDAANRPMTCSLAYNASKAAVSMMTRQMARELRPRQNTTVFGISPTKIYGTKMSKYVDARVPEVRGWTAEYAQGYEKRTLASGQEIEARVLAEFIAFLLSKKERHQYLNGCDIPYGAST